MKKVKLEVFLSCNENTNTDNSFLISKADFSVEEDLFLNSQYLSL